MAVIITGSKYNGSPTTAGTSTLTDSGASFIDVDFLEDNQRIIELFSSGGTWKGMAWVDQQSSSTVLLLTDVFRDIDGNEVTQLTSDDYYVSKNFADVSSIAKTTTGNLIEWSDVLEFGDGTATGVCFYDQNKIVRFDQSGDSLIFALTIKGGFTGFGRVLDWVNFTTTSGCAIYVACGSGVGEGLKIDDPNARFLFAGSQFVNINHAAGRFGGFNGQAGRFFIAMNSQSNANLSSPDAGGVWSINADDHRLINMNYWGTGTVGNGSGIGVRWGDGQIIGGSYGFGVSNNSISMYGHQGIITYDPEIGAGPGSRLRVLNIFETDNKTTLVRTNNVAATGTYNFTNLLCNDRRVGFGATPAGSPNNNVTLNFLFKEKFTDILSGTDAYIWRDNDNIEVDNINGITSGEYEVSILEEEVTGDTPVNTYSQWRAVFLLYGQLPFIQSIVSTTAAVGRATSSDVNFGGPTGQVNDLLITQLDKSIVDSYTTIDDSKEIYDRQFSHWVGNYDGLGASYVSRSGAQIILVAVNLIIDATTGSAFAFATNTITIKSSVFIGGATATTGEVTIQNGALLNGGTFDCDINYQSGAGTTITGVTCTGTVDFDTAGTYTIDGSVLNTVTNSSGGAVTLLLANGSTVATNTGPSITIIQNVDVTNVNLLDGTRVQLYNITQAAELDNSVVSGGTGYSFAVNLLSAGVNPGDILRIRGTYINGVTGKEEYQEAGTITASGLPFIGVQQPSPEYDTWGLDGSLITKFTANYISDRVAITLTGPWQVAELGAWWQYNLTTEQGIREFFSGVTFIDEANIGVNIGTVDIFLDTSLASGTAFQEDNRRFFRIGDESTRPVENPTTGGGAVDVEWRSPVTIANSDNVATKANQVQINENLKLTSLIIPVSQNLPDQ